MKASTLVVSILLGLSLVITAVLLYTRKRQELTCDSTAAYTSQLATLLSELHTRTQSYILLSSTANKVKADQQSYPLLVKELKEKAADIQECALVLYQYYQQTCDKNCYPVAEVFSGILLDAKHQIDLSQPYLFNQEHATKLGKALSETIGGDVSNGTQTAKDYLATWEEYYTLTLQGSDTGQINSKLRQASVQLSLYLGKTAGELANNT